MMLFREKIDRFPPSLVIAQARKNRGRKAMSYAEIAAAAGLSRVQVIRLSRLTHWPDSVSLGTYSKLTEACSVDPLHPRRAFDYLKRRRKVAFGLPQWSLLRRTISGRTQNLGQPYRVPTGRG